MKLDCFAVLAMTILVALLLLPLPATAQPLNTYAIEQIGGEPLVNFQDVDYTFSLAMTPPETGWKRGKVPQVFRASVMKWERADRAIWGRYRFDSAALSGAKLAIYALDSRCQLIFFVNGREVYRNFADPKVQKLSWYKPFLVPIPDALLRPGMNEIMIRAASDESVAVGRLVVGPHVALEKQYLKTLFWHVKAPSIANHAMLVFGMFAFLIWIVLRTEYALLYLAAMTLFCYIRNFQYFGEQIPVDEGLFNAAALYSNVFGGLAGLAFYVHFIGYAYRTKMIILCTAVSLLLCLLHWAFGLSDLLIYLPTTLIGFAMMAICLRNPTKFQGSGNIILSLVVLIVPIISLRDIALFGTKPNWDGNDAFMVVFSGFLYCIAFLASFVKRSLDAFAGLGAANATLEQRIAETRGELSQSEDKRRTLEVGQAVAGERERLMREMHDGIGSNLITALAVAEQQGQPKSTIKTLRRAIGDLKITVDSLEPVEGDLVALLGNLRHRMTADLRDAGLTTKWSVEPCGNLDWLDATNALHVLRIFQEAIGNVLAHAHATVMKIGCREEVRGGVSGISAFVADNGCGFDPAQIDVPGKGLANLRSRASSLHGQLTCESSSGEGATLTLWLPYVR